MANILYGVSGEGAGHSSRARDVIPPITSVRWDTANTATT
jgi:hypothetical protein